MRIVVHHYTDGTRWAYETTLDGVHVRDIEGVRKPGFTIRSSVDVECEDDAESRNAAIAAITLARNCLSLPPAFLAREPSDAG